MIFRITYFVARGHSRNFILYCSSKQVKLLFCLLFLQVYNLQMLQSTTKEAMNIYAKSYEFLLGLMVVCVISFLCQTPMERVVFFNPFRYGLSDQRLGMGGGLKGPPPFIYLDMVGRQFK